MKRLLIIAALCAFAGPAFAQDYAPGFGPNPVLPEPSKSLLPTVNIAKATGWPQNSGPLAANGLKVNAFASDLDHPRWIYVLPNGDVLVAETNAPPKPDDSKGIKGKVMGLVMKEAGAATKSANRITLLRDADHNGVAETETVFLKGLNSPFGMTLVSNNFYVANTDSLMRFPYKDGETEITAAGEKVIDLPGGPINHHWTKNVIAAKDGKHLYVTIGSNSNVGENGLDKETDRAQIWEVDPVAKTHRVFATGIRNPNGLDWEPKSGVLWTAANERDELGDNLVPDYMTSVKDGSFYGWPYSYYGQHVDARVKEQNPDLVAKALPPDYALGAHTASLGLAFYKDGVLIGQHGSWNRKEPAGYKVIYIPFRNGKPAGPPQDFLTGFLGAKGEAQGRPVGVAVAKDGAALVADDVGNVIWRVAP